MKPGNPLHAARLRKALGPLLIVVPGVGPSVNEARGKGWRAAFMKVRDYRTLAAELTRGSVREQGWDSLAGVTPMRLVIQHYVPDLRGDTHNREKALLDGIADGLGINDRHFLIAHAGPPIKDTQAPRVVVRAGPESWYWWEWRKAGLAAEQLGDGDHGNPGGSDKPQAGAVHRKAKDEKPKQYQDHPRSRRR